MDEEKIRIAVAEELGWRIAKRVEPDMKYHADMCWIRPGGDEWQEEEIPKFTESLDVCNQIIDKAEKDGFACVLIAEQGKRCCTFVDTENNIDYKVIDETFPLAICHAFLKTRNNPITKERPEWLVKFVNGLGK